MNPVFAGWTLNHVRMLHVVIIALVADGTEVAWGVLKSHLTLFMSTFTLLTFNSNKCHVTWIQHMTLYFQISPFLWRRVQSGHKSSSWFQAKSQVFPGVTPQLLHRMQVMHTYKKSVKDREREREKKHKLDTSSIDTLLISKRNSIPKNRKPKKKKITKVMNKTDNILTDETWKTLFQTYNIVGLKRTKKQKTQYLKTLVSISTNTLKQIPKEFCSS